MLIFSCPSYIKKTWNGDKFDFHGECDLVLLSNNEFANGLGLNVHVRTKITNWWSSIESAVVQLGENILEIQGDGKKSISYWLDGTKVEEMETEDTILLGNHYIVKFNRFDDHQSRTRIDLGHRNAMSIETFKRFIRVNFHIGGNATQFVRSVGLLGSFPDGHKVGRDGQTVFVDVDNEFGQEWQVLESDPRLFHVSSNVQSPRKCLMPSDIQKNSKKKRQRRLGESLISKQEAHEVCSNVGVKQDELDACIFDVLATNDIEMANSYNAH